MLRTRQKEEAGNPVGIVEEDSREAGQSEDETRNNGQPEDGDCRAPKKAQQRRVVKGRENSRGIKKAG